MSTRLARVIPFLAAAVLSCTTFACSSATDGGETVGEDSDTQALLAGTRLSPADVADLLRDNGFPESAIGPMVCTAKYESSFYERASNHNRNGSTDYGLFQINSVHLGDSGCPDSASSLYDPSENTACAYRIWRSQGFNAWYGFQKHRSLCENYPAP